MRFIVIFFLNSRLLRPRNFFHFFPVCCWFFFFFFSILNFFYEFETSKTSEFFPFFSSVSFDFYPVFFLSFEFFYEFETSKTSEFFPVFSSVSFDFFHNFSIFFMRMYFLGGRRAIVPRPTVCGSSRWICATARSPRRTRTTSRVRMQMRWKLPCWTRKSAISRSRKSLAEFSSQRRWPSSGCASWSRSSWRTGVIFSPTVRPIFNPETLPLFFHELLFCGIYFFLGNNHIGLGTDSTLWTFDRARHRGRGRWRTGATECWLLLHFPVECQG